MKIPSLALALITAAIFAAFAAFAASEATPAHDRQTTLNTVHARSIAPLPNFVGRQAVKLLALETDQSERFVQQVMSTLKRHERHTFRFQAEMARRFAAALGQERFADLVAGRPVKLTSPAALAAARAMAMLPEEAPGPDDVAVVALARN